MAWYESFGLIFRSLIKTENKPKQLDHGANWNSPHGERAPYDPSKALSSYGLHSWTHAAVSRQAQDLAALPLKLMTGKGADAQQIDDHPFLELVEFPSTTMDYYLFAEQLIIGYRETLIFFCWEHQQRRHQSFAYILAKLRSQAMNQELQAMHMTQAQARRLFIPLKELSI